VRNTTNSPSWLTYWNLWLPTTSAIENFNTTVRQLRHTRSNSKRTSNSEVLFPKLCCQWGWWSSSNWSIDEPICFYDALPCDDRDCRLVTTTDAIQMLNWSAHASWLDIQAIGKKAQPEGVLEEFLSLECLISMSLWNICNIPSLKSPNLCSPRSSLSWTPLLPLFDVHANSSSQKMDLSRKDIETYAEKLETAETKGIWFQHRVRFGPGHSKFESPDEGWENRGSCSDFHWDGEGRFPWVVCKCQSIPKFKFEPCLLNPRVPSLSMRTIQRKPRTMASNTPLAIYERTSHYEVLFNVQDKAKSLMSIDLFTESMFLKVLAVNLDMGNSNHELSPIGIIHPSLASRRIQCAELHNTHDTTSKPRPSARYSRLPQGRKKTALFSLLMQKAVFIRPPRNAQCALVAASFIKVFTPSTRL